MREQVIVSRPPRRARGATKDLVQRPNRRGRGSVEARSFSLRALFSYLPTVLKFVLAILTIIAMFVGYRFASSASLFQVRAIDITGASRISRDEIEALVRKTVSRTGVWRTDLRALSAELGRMPGVRRAVVTRVLPDRLRVRVIERVPIAVVRTTAGHFVWVDDEAVGLGEMKTNDQMPPFFIRGWNEDDSTEASEANTERLQKYFAAVREWQAMGLADRVSEVNLADLQDVRAQLAGKDSQIEVRLGAQDFGKRLKMALDVLDEYKQTPRGAFITYVDLQGDYVVLGFSSGGKVTTDSETSSAPAQVTEATTADATKKKVPGATLTDSNRSKEPRARMR